MSAPTALIADDEPLLRKSLVRLLAQAWPQLDVVVQASVLDLLAELRRATQVTLVCISHDLDLVRYLCDTAVVMRRGRVVEQGDVREVFAAPRDPYTAELIAAVPSLTRPAPA